MFKYHFMLMTMLLLACLAAAQDEEPVELPADDDTTVPYTDTYQSETRTDYFLPKWSTEGSMDSIRMRSLPDSAVAALRADEDFWYANHVFAKEGAKVQRTGINKFFNRLLWVLIICGFIAFLVIYLINSNVSMLRRSRSIKGAAEEETVEMDNIFAINYQREIDKAINAGNYRLAVRLMFLRLLRQLADKKVIQYKHDRTNFDYLMQLSNTIWYRPFFSVARSYEYVWYGKFDIDRHQFDNISNEFTSLERQL